MRLLPLLLLLPALAAAQAPDEGRPGTFALTDCRIETVARGTIERGTVVLRDGRIEAVGPDVAAPADAERVDCDGATVYPGFVDAGTKLGLMEIGSMEETRDFREIGAVTPHMQALTAVNVSSTHIPVARVNGVTTVLMTPAGGLLPGTAALVNLHGYTPEQMDTGFRGVVLDFPSGVRRGSWDRRKPEEIEKTMNVALEKLDATWEQALLFARIDSARAADPDPERLPEYVPEMEALLPVVRGEIPLLVEVDAAKDIERALAWLAERGPAGSGQAVRAVLMGVAEGWRVADQLADAGYPVIAGPVQALPSRDADRYSRAYENPALLHDAGVEVALRTTPLNSNDVQNTRNLPYHAGFAAAYGMDRRAALEAVTLAPARIFGVADRLGSIEPGKDATLFVADGDPFEVQTPLRALFIDGYRVPLVSRQTELYEEYLDRTPGLAK